MDSFMNIEVFILFFLVVVPPFWWKFQFIIDYLATVPEICKIIIIIS